MGKLFTLALIPSLISCVISAPNRPAITKEHIIRTDVLIPTETVLSPADFAAAETVVEIDLQSIGIEKNDLSVSKSKFEGDIAGHTSKTIHQYIDDSNDYRRNAIKDQWLRWPNGEIPYTISSQYGDYSKQIIAKAMNEYHTKTCIKFVPRDPAKHRDYINIYPDDGCYSYVGKSGGMQPVSLDAGCIETGIVIHELMHTAGFFHEQSRNDRDDWITISYENIMSDAVDQFEKYDLRTITHLDEQYDYNSVMHYGSYAFTKNGRKTILPKKSGGESMGQRNGFSTIDLRKINKLYNCPQNTEVTTSSVKVTTAPPTVAPTASAVCEDNSWICAIPSFCGHYEQVRNELCRKTCGTCTNKQQPTTTTTTKKPTTTTKKPTTTTKKPTTTTRKTLINSNINNKGGR